MKEKDTINTAHSSDFDDDIQIFNDDEVVSLEENQVEIPSDDQRKKWQLDKRWALFMNPRVHGLCFNPWQWLKVDIFAKTNVCCTYFGRLPKFEFVSAKEFHDEGQMWNHPFMQHMRSQNGKKDEVPYCGFCQGRYRNDLPGRTARRLSIIESQKLLQDKMDEVIKFEYKGSLSSLHEDLSTWSSGWVMKSGKEWKPFKSERQFYRRDLRLAGFQNAGDVALFGSGLHAYAPFLAEANTSLQVFDWQPGKLKMTEILLDALNLGNAKFVSFESKEKLPIEHNSLDGVWLDARRWFQHYPMDWLFGELKRVLKPGGKLRVVLAPGPADVILKILNEEDESNVEVLIATLRDENERIALNTYFTVESLYKKLKRKGFALDKERPAQIKTIGKAFRELPVLGRDLSVIAEKLQSPQYREQLKSNRDQLNGLDEYISFNASKIVKRSAAVEIPVKIVRTGDISVDEFRFKE